LEGLARASAILCAGQVFVAPDARKMEAEFLGSRGDVREDFNTPE